MFDATSFIRVLQYANHEKKKTYMKIFKPKPTEPG